MQLSPDDIDRLVDMYARMTSREMAEELGISHCNMRRILSDNGISDPCREEMEKQRSLLRRFWMKGEPRTICQFLGISLDALRMRVKRMNLPTGQTRLPL